MLLAHQDLRIDLLVLVKRIYVRYLSLDLQEQDLTDLQTVLRYFLLQLQIQYPKKYPFNKYFLKRANWCRVKPALSTETVKGQIHGQQKEKER